MSAKNGAESNMEKEELIAQLNRIACALEKGQNEAEKELSAPLVAAYALNLCLVSISQIIDYSDIYVLEQEYESILNNLNLEHMPKDEALLDILRQILDTITFFRIQESEKKLIEQEYQARMKNAIWKAVPNFGVIVTSSDPLVILTSLASQVGIGYMNYRKEKAATSALDPISTSRIEDLAMELKEKYTIVMVTHNMQQAVRISDQTAFFLLGDLVEYGNTEQMFSQPKDKRTEDYITGRFG